MYAKLKLVAEVELAIEKGAVDLKDVKEVVLYVHDQLFRDHKDNSDKAQRGNIRWELLAAFAKLLTKVCLCFSSKDNFKRHCREKLKKSVRVTDGDMRNLLTWHKDSFTVCNSALSFTFSIILSNVTYDSFPLPSSLYPLMLVYMMCVYGPNSLNCPGREQTKSQLPKNSFNSTVTWMSSVWACLSDFLIVI